MQFEDEGYSDEPFFEMDLLGPEFKLFLRRELGNEIRSLDKTPPVAMNFFFARGDFESGDMIADESGNLWTFVEDEYSIYLISSFPLKGDEHCILYVV